MINFNEAEKTASVYTFNKSLKKKLDALTAERPDEVQRTRENFSGEAVEYIIPKTWIKIKPPRVMSEAQAAALCKAREALRAQTN